MSIMSEEEKKAIETLEEVRILLNLVDKQQEEIEEKFTIIIAGAEKVKQLEKEIEELKSIASEFINRNIEQFSIGEFNYKVKHFKNDYIHKDKIREKLKELEEQFKKYENEGLSGFVSKIDKGTRIEVLKELLEEN